MSVYFVTYPNMDISATVTAPSTDKARTTFLDWLERTGRISRKNRQQLRRHLVAERLEFPEEVDADVRLNYQYDGEAVEELEPVRVAHEVPPELETGFLEEEEPFGEEEPMEREAEIEEEEALPEPILSGTPIGELSTRSAR